MSRPRARTDGREPSTDSAPRQKLGSNSRARSTDMASAAPARDYKRIVQRGYDRISTAYRDDAGASNPEYFTWLQAYLLPRLTPSARVLDLGCGNGVPTARILSQHHDVIGVDISAVQIRRARKLVPEATFIRQDMATVEFPWHSFDAVVSFFALIHVPISEQREIISRLSVWLRPGGLFLGTVGLDAWTGFADFYGTTMYWSQAAASTYVGWLKQAGIDVIAQEFIPEAASAGHQLLVGVRRGS